MPSTRFDDKITNSLGTIPPGKIAIAVSGGSDSVALMHLASIWARGAGVQLVILSVDHNLRAGSKDEIRYIAKLARDLGHEFYPLSWDCGGSKVALQERARQGRYDLMTSKCHDLGIDILLTAHHMDDMFETYLMRKSKKSSILGLSSTDEFFHNNIRILRPLSGCSKAELVHYLEQNNIGWLEDESNRSDAYERNRIRKQLALYTRPEKLELAQEIAGVNNQASVLNERLIIAMAELLSINEYGFAMIDLAGLKKERCDIQIPILNYILTVISGKTATPRFRSIRKLLAKLAHNEKIDSSLHGCILKETSKGLLIYREYSAIDKIKMPVDFAKNNYWDGRFEIISPQSCDGYYIDCLKFSDYIELKDKINLRNLAKISDNNHKSILFTLSAIRRLEKIVAIPNISYYDSSGLEISFEVIFRPSFISRFTHFL